MPSSPSTSYDLPVTSAAPHDGETSTVFTAKRYTKTAQALDCFKLIFFLIIIVVLLGLVPGVTRLLMFLQPNTPEFKIQSSSLSVVNVSQDSVTADFDVAVSVHNRNKKNVFFDEIESFLVLSDRRVSTVRIAALEAQGNSQTSLKGEFRNFVMNVTNCGFGKCGDVNLTVEFEVEAEYEGFTWPTKMGKIRVLCENFRVSANMTTTTTKRMDLGSRECNGNGRWKRLVTKCDNIFWNYIYVATVFVGILLLSL